MLQELGPKDTLPPHSFTKLRTTPPHSCCLKSRQMPSQEAQGSLASMKLVQSPQESLLMRKAELLASRQCLQQLIMFTDHLASALGSRGCD